MQKVNSKIIEGVDHDGDVLRIKFHGGAEYAYWPVSEEEYRELLNADSAGGYFSKNIKGVKEYERVNG